MGDAAIDCTASMHAVDGEIGADVRIGAVATAAAGIDATIGGLGGQSSLIDRDNMFEISSSSVIVGFDRIRLLMMRYTIDCGRGIDIALSCVNIRDDTAMVRGDTSGRKCCCCFGRFADSTDRKC